MNKFVEFVEYFNSDKGQKLQIIFLLSVIFGVLAYARHDSNVIKEKRQKIDKFVKSQPNYDDSIKNYIHDNLWNIYTPDSAHVEKLRALLIKRDSTAQIIDAYKQSVLQK